MRRVHAGFAIVVLCLGAGLPSLSCRFGGGHGWGMGGEGGAGYEIEILRCDERVFLVLAANGCLGGGGGGGGGLFGGGAFRGKMRAMDGREIAWSCSTRDGTGGTVRVDGQRFDLGKGAVFLVRTNDKKTKVEQIAADMSRLQGAWGPGGTPMREKLQALGDTEPRIAEFFKDSRAGK